MTTREQHAPRTFVFRPGEIVYLLPHKKNRRADLKVIIQSGKSLILRGPGPLHFQMPLKGSRSVVLSLHIDFRTKPSRLHLDRQGVNVQLVGSEGTLYHHRVLPGPSSSTWDFSIISVPKGKVLYFCLQPGCRQHGQPVDNPPKTHVCNSCAKGKLVANRF